MTVLTRQDLEVVMLEMKDTFKRYIPYYILQMNLEKNDTLLGEISIIGTELTEEMITEDMLYDISIEVAGENAFLPEAFYLWEMKNIPPYKVSFLLYVQDDPEIVSLNGEEHSLRHKLAVACLINDTGDENLPIIKHRYNRIITSIIQDVISEEYIGVNITNINTRLEVVAKGTTYEVAEVAFELVIV